MTIISEPPPRATRDAVQHPDWCWPASCSVQPPSISSGFCLGDHVGRLENVSTAYGTKLQIGLMREHEDDEPHVLVISTSIDEPDNPGAYHEERLVPEEARLIARRLLEAADAVEAAR